MQAKKPIANLPSPLPRLLVTAAACLLLSACASVQESEPATGLAGARMEAPTGPRWFRIRFRNSWPEEVPAPRWEQDLLLAETVVRPVLRMHENRLFRWRFHRRATRSSPGHQFSFIFFTDTATATQIHRQVENDPIVLAMFNAGRLQQLSFDDTGDMSLSATSDSGWPANIQEHWPLFIMGASALWLELIGECDGARERGVSLEDLMTHYSACQEQVTGDWHRWGQHAYLHHLSALFGYTPLRIRKDIRF